MESRRSNDDKDVMQLTEQRELPHEFIIEMILTRLPIKSILRFKSVSKLWYSKLSSSRFASAHLNFPNPSPATESLLIRNPTNSKLDYVVNFDEGNENMYLVGTCNGLVCLGSSSGRLSIVWNPITREFRKYLDSKFFRPECLVYWGFGYMVTSYRFSNSNPVLEPNRTSNCVTLFGYVSAVDDYKIVRLCKDMSSYSLTVHVYSIRLNKWKIIDNDAFDDISHLRNPVIVRISGVLVNETLYWRLPGKNISFNLASETLDTFSYLEVSNDEEIDEDLSTLPSIFLLFCARP
ncbi:hypothetical protein RND81_09G055800 [Saponaria officinalis]|uniref:F-box domain-containing protein n=1 Tax=Saponaria officinalis TaxID=3572 RepID=A0AAW1IGX6_SAPOF